MKESLSRRAVLAGGASLAAGIALPAAAQSGKLLRYGNAGSAGTVSNTFNAALSRAISAKTGGRLAFEIFAGTLGGEKSLIESMALGSLDVYNGAYTGIEGFDVMYSPYFFRDGPHARAVLASEIGARASATLERRYKARLLGAGRLGSYNLMLKRPIQSLADLKGRKIRAPEIKGCIEALRFFGAAPTPIPFNEVYLALQSGIVDGVLTALNPGVQFKFYEVCKYVVVPDFGLALDKQVISLSAWNGLTAEQKQIVQDSFNELEESQYYQVGLAAKPKDFKAWSDANGADSLLNLEASGLASQMAPLNERLAEAAFGKGSWQIIQNTKA
jgi:TRAP-type C4-dicarboxylate transport system substrate-binding protein